MRLIRIVALAVVGGLSCGENALAQTTADTAKTETVLVRIKTPSRAQPGPIASRTDEYTLKFDGQAWKVTSVRTASRS